MSEYINEDVLEEVEAGLDRLSPWELEQMRRKRVEKFVEEARKYLERTENRSDWHHETSLIIQTQILLELRKLRKFLGDRNE
jgi:hypothetical protein